MPRPADAHTPLKALDFVVLAVLNDGPRHGYALALAVAERRHHAVRPVTCIASYTGWRRTA